MIEVTLRDILDTSPVLKSLKEKQLKGKVAFQLARLMREIEKEYNILIDTRQQLIEQYAEKNERGEIIIDEEGNGRVSKNQIQSFNNEMNKLLNTIIKLNVDFLDIEDLEEENFTLEQMYILSLYIKK